MWFFRFFVFTHFSFIFSAPFKNEKSRVHGICIHGVTSSPAVNSVGPTEIDCVIYLYYAVSHDLAYVGVSDWRTVNVQKK
jgi:hypothetical protein